jgi:hypothetical protein
MEREREGGRERKRDVERRRGGEGGGRIYIRWWSSTLSSPTGREGGRERRYMYKYIKYI